MSLYGVHGVVCAQICPHFVSNALGSQGYYLNDCRSASPLLILAIPTQLSESVVTIMIDTVCLSGEGHYRNAYFPCLFGVTTKS